MITIYYSYYSEDNIITTGLRQTQPKAIRNVVGYDHSDHQFLGYRFCPAYRNHLKNIYALTASFDYGLYLENDQIRTNHRDQNFFNDYVLVRSVPDKLISLKMYCLMIPDCESLLVSQTPAYLESNDFTESTIVIPGTFDIGKWPRPIECAFHMKKDRFEFKENDSLSYIKFHTDKNIQFKQFMMTPLLQDYKDMLTKSKENKNNISPTMDFFYDLISKKSKLKRKMLEEAKNNCLQ